MIINKMQTITPNTVESSTTIDYDKIINKFGSTRIDNILLDRFRKCIGVEILNKY